ncbi:glutathione peroxidase [Paenibacillus macquariensis]|uniref:Glutathione peroxidase n=1 Tax=Paenibacillus macquariensis TaxID=948756 RepID=A0ABY1JRE8_9BACL|nr:glutathione peroxidase [Paenibacillus macquariensis]MEC0092747.1 glutathione peroxidase [Paenibacillus macquariensis]OAB36138.1 glutathione peroxidase [Paenibacillus macquariensis subsp. macquariensis]SIQ65324.1 glutathione peroxidase [Paenibacillus macquariensis]
MSIYDYQVNTIRGEQVSLSNYQGKVLLIVNTASKCGFTPQYTGLQELYEKYKDHNFEILGFPSNQFKEQEPGSNDDIEQFCQLNHGVTFPLFEKIDVKGNTAHPLFQYLSKQAPGVLGSTAVKWNFTKFLVDSDGKVIKRFAPATTPDKIEHIIEDLLK